MSRSSVQKLGVVAALAITTSVLLLLAAGSPSSHAEAPAVATSEAATSHTIITPQPVQSRVIKPILRQLDRYHYINRTLNDQTSSELLDQYIDLLDKQRYYYTVADIANFDKYRGKLDDQLDNGNLEAAFAIYNLYLQRHKERLNYSIQFLNDGGKKLKFDGDEALMLDRSEQPRPQNTAELQVEWKKLAMFDVLNRVLAGDEVEEAAEKITHRYENRLNQLGQTTAVDVFETFINAYATMYDPHTRYMSPRAAENFDIRMNLSLKGIGAMLESDFEYTKVVSLVTGGPAEQAGDLKAADLITGVGQGEDGEIENVVGMRLDEVVSRIRGPQNSVVQLEVVRTVAGVEQPAVVFSITRDVINLTDQQAKSERLELKREDQTFSLGVVKIPNFYSAFGAKRAGDPDYRSVTRDVAEEVLKLQREGIDGLVIDLRNNSGGSLDEVNAMVGLFITDGPTVQVRQTGSRVKTLRDRDPRMLYQGPMAVLVNRYSASASEIFAGAMQDYQRAVVIGGRTFGKGTVQTLTPLIDDGRLKYTQAKFYRVSGGSTQNKGVEPDIAFPVIFDEETIGESALPDALPWDTIPPAKYNLQGAIGSLLPQLRSLHEQRVSNSEEFGYLRAQAKYLDERRSEKTISLNKATRLAEREKNQSRRLELENRRRIALDLEPWKSFTDFEEADIEEEKDLIPDAELQETGEILQDLVLLANNPQLVTTRANAARKIALPR